MVAFPDIDGQEVADWSIRLQNLTLLARGVLLRHTDALPPCLRSLQRAEASEDKAQDRKRAMSADEAPEVHQLPLLQTLKREFRALWCQCLAH